MINQIMQTIIDKIEEYDKIILFRHIRPDGDCVGSSKGLCEILRLSFPEKDVRVVDWQKCDYLAFLDIEEESVDDSLYADALALVIDTATSDRISNQKFSLCREVVKIDHHIPLENYGSHQWVEEERSSCCEMIVALYDAFREELKMDSEAATYLYTGMVTDSGRFRYQGVSGDTMRCAATLLDKGIDTENLFANLYLEEYGFLKFKAYVYENMNITENGVAYVHVTAEMKEKFGLTDEDASNSVSMMDGIKGTLCWLAFIDSSKEPGTIRVRLRSRFMTVNQIAEQYRGGGHACASGATVYSEEEKMALVAMADAASKAYKESHEGWL